MFGFTLATFFASASALLANTDTDVAHQATLRLATYSAWIAERWKDRWYLEMGRNRRGSSPSSLRKPFVIQEDIVQPQSKSMYATAAMGRAGLAATSWFLFSPATSYFPITNLANDVGYLSALPGRHPQRILTIALTDILH
ncbi:hypothetical protein BDQ12DRAFT_722508 [Crucibulum laeve]|uniref:Uncharacterized protein n=1 Tax=Crucibulum laeve TaxID=68775 RepID=A0A5C3M2S0_9AGAR|nr:hypothetical protein BDQ12DRAFT_722508 [Crucibulum laeve]